MVITDFNIVSVAVDEAKADSPLVVDGDRVLTLSIVLERVQSIAGRHLEIIKRGSKVDILEFANGACYDVDRKALPCPS